MRSGSVGGTLRKPLSCLECGTSLDPYPRWQIWCHYCGVGTGFGGQVPLHAEEFKPLRRINNTRLHQRQADDFETVRDGVYYEVIADECYEQGAPLPVDHASVSALSPVSWPMATSLERHQSEVQASAFMGAADVSPEGPSSAWDRFPEGGGAGAMRHRAQGYVPDPPLAMTEEQMQALAAMRDPLMDEAILQAEERQRQASALAPAEGAKQKEKDNEKSKENDKEKDDQKDRCSSTSSPTASP